MLYDPKIIRLKDGRNVLLRSPLSADAEKMNEYLRICAAETPFILRYPEECTATAEQEADYLEGINRSDTGLMIVAQVDDEIAGNCQLVCNRLLKTRHRAQIAIGLVSKYWNLGIGTALLAELSAAAKGLGVEQLELEYIEGNERARRLYEKSGFVTAGEHPDAIKLRDGALKKLFYMVKKL